MAEGLVVDRQAQRLVLTTIDRGRTDLGISTHQALNCLTACQYCPRRRLFCIIPCTSSCKRINSFRN